MAESAGNGRDALESAALTDVGLRRANNQDTFALALAGDDLDWQRRGHLFMVADGMGAHAAGELASKMACEALPHTYRKLLDRTPAEALRQAVLAANATIHERGQAYAEFQGMGTTCSVLVLLPTVAIVAQVGDSRVYRLRGDRLDQLTFDHSLVWEMTVAGQMPRGEVASFIPKNIITRSLGPHANVQVDLEGPFPLEVGDTFLLCSDGLSGQIKDEEIGAILSTLSPPEAVRVLVDMANLRGGPDNITAVVARVLSVPVADSEEPSATYIELVRGVPLITILFMAQLLLPLFLPTGWTVDRVIRAMVAITLFSAAYLAENVRGGLQAIPRGQYEAAHALGLNGLQTMIFVILPQALRLIIPILVGQFIAVFKDTSLVAIVGLLDLVGIGKTVLAQPAFLGLQREVYAFISLIYWVLSYGMSYLSQRLEPKGEEMEKTEAK